MTDVRLYVPPVAPVSPDTTDPESPTEAPESPLPVGQEDDSHHQLHMASLHISLLIQQ